MQRWLPGRLFAAAFPLSDGSQIHAWNILAAFGLGSHLNNTSQVRGLIEAGIIF